MTNNGKIREIGNKLDVSDNEVNEIQKDKREISTEKFKKIDLKRKLKKPLFLIPIIVILNILLYPLIGRAGYKIGYSFPFSIYPFRIFLYPLIISQNEESKKSIIKILLFLTFFISSFFLLHSFLDSYLIGSSDNWHDTYSIQR